MWTTYPNFKQIVSSIWQSHVSGFAMLILWSKLKLLARVLLHVNKEEFSDISNRVVNCKTLLDDLQTNLQLDPFNQELLDEERVVAIYYNTLKFIEESYFQQKAKANWIHLGDQNTKYFHQSHKQ